MAVDDNSVSSLLDEWNQLFPPRDFPPFKFIPNDRSAFPPNKNTPSIGIERINTTMLSRATEKGSDRLVQQRRSKRVMKIYTKFCDYLVFQLVRKPLMTVGFPMEKLQESNPGKVSRITLGLDIQTESVWWNHGLSRSFLRFRDIVRLEYSLSSPCYTKLKSRGQNHVVPWNCFSLVTVSRSFDFYVVTSDMENCEDVDNFLFAFSYVLNDLSKQFPVFGLFESKRQIALIRGKMKINFMLHRSIVFDTQPPSQLPVSPKTPTPGRQPVDSQDDDDKEIAEEFFNEIN